MTLKKETLKKIIKPQGRDKEKKKEQGKTIQHPKAINTMAMRAYLLMITLNVNVLNSTIKKLKVAECIKRQDLSILCYL